MTSPPNEPIQEPAQRRVAPETVTLARRAQRALGTTPVVSVGSMIVAAQANNVRHVRTLYARVLSDPLDRAKST